MNTRRPLWAAEHWAVWPVVALLLGLPWVTWFSWWGYRTGGEAAREIPLYLFTALALVGLGAWIARTEVALGAFVAFMALRAIGTHTALALATAHWIALGALLLLAVPRWPAAWLRRLRWAVVLSGALECAYVILQATGHDPLWSPLDGWKPVGPVIPHGTLDHPTLIAAMLAMLLPLAPLWLLPVYAAGLVVTHSLVATLAAIAGGAVRWRKELGLIGMSGVVIICLAATAWLFALKSHDSAHERVFAWTTALREMDRSWPALLFGFGPGGWYRVVPAAQLAAQPGRTEVFYQAHNEYLQLFFEGGLVAMACLVGFAWRHRRALMVSGSAVALGVICAGTFPLHVAPTAATALLVLILAIGMEPAREPDAPASWRYWC